MILDAEKFGGEVAKPQGTDSFSHFFSGVRKISEQEVIDNDEFFHVTCHVDKSLTQKIQNGEYVDLEKLLVKDRFCKCSNDDCLEFVTRDGHTYLTTVQDRENRIYGLQKWEQAFRVYAAIYSKANPSRSAEIWHYLYIINTAVSSYAWENVAYYDFTFRQMISHNPNRSWAKLYSHLWNLAITEAIRQIWFPGEHEQHTQKQFHVKQWRKKWQKIKSPLLEIQQKPTL